MSGITRREPKNDEIDLDIEFDFEDELDWDADPARILEAKELAEGYNCFGHPIQ